MSSSISNYSIFYFIFFLHCFGGTLQGCQTPKAQTNPNQPSPPAKKEKKNTHQKASDHLFAAILEVLEEEEIHIYLQDNDAHLILSEYKKISSEVRQRFVIRVLSTSRGLLFRVRSVYERRDRRNQKEFWVEQIPKKKRSQAYRDEQNLGKAIRERFRQKEKN